MAVAISLGQHSATAKTADPMGTLRSSVEGRRVSRSKDWVRGWWENITPEPVYITDKYHLKQVCLAYSKKIGQDVIPEAFAKPKSQGKGIEWNF